MIQGFCMVPIHEVTTNGGIYLKKLAYIHLRGPPRANVIRFADEEEEVHHELTGHIQKGRLPLADLSLGAVPSGCN